MSVGNDLRKESDRMKVIAFNGSPKEKGNTYFSLRTVADVLEKEEIEVEIIHVGDKAIRGCTGCYGCGKNKNEKCIIDTDLVNECIPKVIAADGILLGSPVYYSGINGSMKSFLDRLFYACSANGGLMRHKIGASVTAVRRTGGMPAFNQLNHYFLISEMLVPSSSYWNVIHGGAVGEVLQDTEGIHTLTVLGENMAWLMKLKEAGRDTVQEPEQRKKPFMNFIR